MPNFGTKLFTDVCVVTYGPVGVTLSKSHLTFTAVNLSDFQHTLFRLKSHRYQQNENNIFLEGHYIIVASETNGNPFREFLLRKPLSTLRTK